MITILAQADSRHIVRQHHAPYQHKLRDGNLQIAMYLEYLPSANLGVLMSKEGEGSDVVYIGEVDLWDMFYCLALAVSAIRGERRLRVLGGFSWAFEHECGTSGVSHFDLVSQVELMVDSLKLDNGKCSGLT